MRNLWWSIAYTSGTRVYALLLGVLTLSLTARLLGPEGRGQVATITTWVTLFSTFGYLSLGQVALHRLTTDRQSLRFGFLLGSLMLLAVVLTFIGWLVALGLYYFAHDRVFKNLSGLVLILGFMALPFLIWEQYGSSLLMGLERLTLYNKYQIIGRTVGLVSLLVFLLGLGLGIEGVLTSNLLSQIIVAMGGMGFLLQYARDSGTLCRPAVSEIKELLKGGVKLHLNAIGTFLFSSASILILNHYQGPEQTGYYQLALQLLGVAMIIPQSASMVIYGKVASLGPDRAWPYNKKLLVQLTGAMMLLSILAALLAPLFIPLIAGEAFRPAIEVFQWMLLGLIGMTFSTVMAPQWIGRGYFWQAAALTLLVGIASIVMNIYLIQKYGLQGSIYAFIGTYVISVLGNGLMALHCEGRYEHTKRYKS